MTLASTLSQNREMSLFHFYLSPATCDLPLHVSHDLGPPTFIDSKNETQPREWLSLQLGGPEPKDDKTRVGFAGSLVSAGSPPLCITSLMWTLSQHHLLPL